MSKGKKELKEKKTKQEPNKVGRPAFFDSKEKLQSKIDEYFNNCPDKRTVVAGEITIDIPCPTITGLALFLGFCDRHSLYDYENRGEFSHTIKTARTKIESAYEKLLHGNSCTGAIFALKNFGWVDKQEVANINANINIKDEEVINKVVDKLKEL